MSTKLSLSVSPHLTAYGPRDEEVVVLAEVDVGPVVERAPQRVVLAVDHSSSMTGRPLEDAVACAKALVDVLSPADEVAVIAFDKTVETVLEPVLLDDAGRRRAHEVLDVLKAGWGTDLCGAFVRATELAGGSARAGRAVVLTDGHPFVGETDSDVILRRVSEVARPAVGLATIGLGRHADRLLLRSVALAGRGRFTYVESGTSAAEAIGSELAVIDGTAVVAVRAEVLLSPAATEVTAYERVPTERTERGLSLQLPPLVAGQPLGLVLTVAPRALDGLVEGPVELGLVRISGRRAIDGSPVVAETPIRIERAAARGVLRPAVILGQCRARAACLMHDVSCDQDRSAAALAVWIAREVGEIVALARSADVLGDRQLAAALSILEDATKELLEAEDEALDRLRVASDAVSRGYDAAPGASPPVDLGAYRSAAQEGGICTMRYPIRQ
ncbi:MAG: hypothetical protein OHK0013_49810 [Sandaracinaceae bacterium]